MTTGQLNYATQKDMPKPHNLMILDARRQAREDWECGGVCQFNDLACNCQECMDAYRDELDLMVEARR